MKPLLRSHSDKRPNHSLTSEMNGLLQQFFNDPLFSSSSFFDDSLTLTPAMNISEKKDRYVMEVEIPGVDPEEVEIELDGNVMIIKGEKSHTVDEDKDSHMHITEHSYGSFYRSVSLPKNIDAEHISADSKNGMLYIEIPKSEKSKTHKINIRKHEK